MGSDGKKEFDGKILISFRAMNHENARKFMGQLSQFILDLSDVDGISTFVKDREWEEVI